MWLNFGGATTEASSLWGESKAKPFTLDDDDSEFSEEEVDAIIAIWEKVAEDFIIFDVDVTTHHPSLTTSNFAHIVVTAGTQLTGKSMPGAESTVGVALFRFFTRRYSEPIAFGKHTPSEVVI